MVSIAHINPDVLRWMRERADLSVDDAAMAVGLKSGQLQNWEAGQTKPTFRQAQKLAQTFRAPFGFLFLAAPPVETLPLPDLRTVGSEPLNHPGIDLQDTARQALQRQAWY